jgi:hypothetical protein
MLSLVGLFNPASRETVEMLYEFEKPYVVDSSKFEKAFGVTATPVNEAILRVLEHYQLPQQNTSTSVNLSHQHR